MRTPRRSRRSAKVKPFAGPRSLLGSTGEPDAPGGLSGSPAGSASSVMPTAPPAQSDRSRRVSRQPGMSSGRPTQGPRLGTSPDRLGWFPPLRHGLPHTRRTGRPRSLGSSPRELPIRQLPWVSIEHQGVIAPFSGNRPRCPGHCGWHRSHRTSEHAVGRSPQGVHCSTRATRAHSRVGIRASFVQHTGYRVCLSIGRRGSSKAGLVSSSNGAAVRYSTTRHGRVGNWRVQSAEVRALPRLLRPEALGPARIPLCRDR